jgi:hypothetical protein
MTSLSLFAKIMQVVLKRVGRMTAEHESCCTQCITAALFHLLLTFILEPPREQRHKTYFHKTFISLITNSLRIRNAVMMKNITKCC